MATNTEIRTLFGDGDMLNKVQASLAKIAYEVTSGNDTGAPYSQLAGAHDKRVDWVSHMLNNPDSESKKVWIIVLGANDGATVAQITGASDSVIDTNCREAVDALSEAYAKQVV